MKDIVGTKPTPPPSQIIFEGVNPDPRQPKPSPNPLKWNWTAIIAWAVIGIVVYNLVTFIFS